MTSLIIIILAVYHLLGLQHAPFKAQLEAGLQPPKSSHIIAQPAPQATVPVKKSDEVTGLSATAVYAVDVASGQAIVSVNATKPLPIASLTKITTALVLLQNHAAGETITVPAIGPYDPADALLHIRAGEQFKFESLLAAALIPSDNDAAEALATSDSGTIAAFSDKMNRLTTEWGIAGTHYVSASGLTDENNFATAEALANLAKLGLANSLFAKLTSTASAQITDLSGQAFGLKTTNDLLGTRTTGIKTGYTPAAGQCFVGLAVVQGHQVITVVLGSTDRFGETARLLDYINRNYSWQ